MVVTTTNSSQMQALDMLRLPQSTICTHFCTHEGCKNHLKSDRFESHTQETSCNTILTGISSSDNGSPVAVHFGIHYSLRTSQQQIGNTHSDYVLLSVESCGHHCIMYVTRTHRIQSICRGFARHPHLLGLRTVSGCSIRELGCNPGRGIW